MVAPCVVILFTILIVGSKSNAADKYNPYGDDEVAVYKLLLSQYPHCLLCRIQTPSAIDPYIVQQLQNIADNASMRQSDVLQLYWLIEMYTTDLIENEILGLLQAIVNAIEREMKRNNLYLDPDYMEFCSIINPDGTAPLKDDNKKVQSDLEASYNNMRNFFNQILPPLSYRLQRDIAKAVQEYTIQTRPLTQVLIDNISVLFSQMYQYYLLHY